MARKMKDSGVEWIGEIPEEWRIVKFKTQADIIMGQSPNGNDIKSEGQTLFMQGNREFGEKYPNPTLYCDTCNKHSRVGDIIMSVRAPVGAINEADKVYGIGRGLCSIKAENIDNGFLKYYLKKSVDDLRYYSKGSTFEAITVEILENFSIVFPTRIEQQKIADFLDEKVGEIDTIIAKTKESIEEYKKYKQAVITETVTKGLDKTVQMKDSGVEWIGEIPENWRVDRLKKIFDFGKGLSITKADLTEEGISVISYGQIHSKTNTGTGIKRDLIRFVPKSYLESNSNSLVHKNDFIFADTSEDRKGCGNCVYIDSEQQIFAGYHTIILQNKDEDDTKYLAYLFLTDAWRSQIRSRVTGVKLFSITQKIIKKTTLILPPKAEQKKIVDFLDKKILEIDNIILIKEKFIEEMETYKKSLIYEYVTGKKEVL